MPTVACGSRLFEGQQSRCGYGWQAKQKQRIYAGFAEWCTVAAMSSCCSIDAIDVKKIFMLAELMKERSVKDFSDVQSEVEAMSMSTLHEKIWAQRRERFDSLNWTFQRVLLSDCGVWPNMCGINSRYCLGNVVQTAALLQLTVPPSLKEKLCVMERRLKFMIDNLPIILVRGGTIRNNPHYTQTRFDIDDGNARAVLYSFADPKKEVPALVGL